MTRVRISLFLGLFVCLFTGKAAAQNFYTYPGAPAVTEFSPAIGASVGGGDDLLRILGYARFDAAKDIDFGIEMMIERIDGDGRFGVGTDVKFGIIPRTNPLPFDISLNTGFGIATGAGFTNFRIPAGAIISRAFELTRGRQLIPYGGLYFIIEHISVDRPARIPNSSHTDIDAELRGGVRVLLNKTTSMFATLHVGGDDAVLFLGVGLDT